MQTNDFSTTSVRQPPKALAPFKDQKGVSQGRTGSKDPHEFNHREWCERAWTAIQRSLARYPSKIDPEEEKETFLNRFEERSRQGTAIKWLKFHTAYVFGFAMNQSELPTCPGPLQDHEHPGRPVGGSLGRALKQIMYRGRAGNKNCQRVAYDVMMSKIGFPPAPESFVEAALKDHKAALSRLPDASPAPETQTILSAVEHKLDEVCDSLFKGVTFEHVDPLPSLRASLESGLKDGGAIGTLLGSFAESRRFLGDGEVREEDLVEPEMLYGITWTPSEGLRELRFIPAGDVVSSFQDHVDELWSERLAQPLEAQPCGILEPLKVRTITKGQAPEYYRTLEIQKMMHGRLRHHPVFEYIGHPIDDASWAKAFGTKNMLKPDEFYVSGDYKAATDNLNPRLSEYCWWAIAWRVKVMWKGQLTELVNTPYAELGLKALTHHRLFYQRHDMTKKQLLEALIKAKSLEEAEALEFEIVDQTWGQLMGSPMSFPILCLVNTAATLAALDQTFSRSLRLRVNGDDIGFIANPDSYAKWKKFTSTCGLECSIGKNYTSRDFLIMNSELRFAPEAGEDIDAEPSGFLEDSGTTYGWVPTYNFVSRPKTWRYEGFLNQSILYNIVRKGMDAGKPKLVFWTDLCDLSRDVLSGIPGKEQWKVLSIFIHTYLPAIERAPPLCNLFVPRPLGGMGVAIPETKDASELIALHRKPEIVEAQLKQAAFLACDPARRQEMPRTPTMEAGYLNNVFKELRQLSDGQARPKLVKTVLMYTGQRPILCGETYLGYVIRSVGDYFMEPHEQTEPISDVHIEKAHRELRKRYAEWTKGSTRHSLSPMKVDSLFDFAECYRYQSVIEVLREISSARSFDGNYQPCNLWAERGLGIEDLATR